MRKITFFFALLLAFVLATGCQLFTDLDGYNWTSDTNSETGSERGTSSDGGNDTDTETGTGTYPGNDTLSDVDSSTNTDTGTSSSQSTDSSIDSDTDTGTEDTESVTETVVDTDTSTDSDTDTDTVNDICQSGWTGETCNRCLMYVNGDSGDDSQTGTGAGRSWATAFKTVQKAINAASTSGCEIWVAASSTSYVENIHLVDRVAVLGGFAGDETVQSQRNWEQNETILDGNKTDTVATCTATAGCGDDAIIDGFTITNGEALEGGGMYNESTSPTIANCIFKDNALSVLSGYGAGIYNDFASPLIVNCTFTGNVAASGGGMYNINNSSPVIKDCTFKSNGGYGSGGGMYNESSSPIVTACTFIENDASSAGAMYNKSSSPMVTNCTFLDNTAKGGGGIINDSSSPTMTNCVFSGNSASLGTGGGMSNTLSSPTITNCTFFDNTAASAGGGMVNSQASSPLITSCIFWGNTASDGAELYNSDSESAPVVSFSDVEGGYSGFNNINDAPLFEPDTFRLQANSPCVNTGYNDALPADTIDLDDDDNITEPIPFDLDGNSRTKGGTVDMGPYEFQE